METTQFIDKYLSEKEKKEIEINLFKERIKKELFKSSEGTFVSDSEIQRITANITAEIVFQEVQNHIPDYKKIVKEKTIKAINSDSFSYYVFKKNDAWESKESLAVTYINETIQNNKQLIQDKIKQQINNFDFSTEISKQISIEFEKLAISLQSLSDLFLNKIEK